MSTEVREVEVGGRHVAVGRLHIGDSPPWGLRLVVGEEDYSVVGEDLFESLVSLRRLLEADDRVLCVEGARGDVFPSGMARQMSGGRQACRIVQGRRPEREDLVDIFDQTCRDEVVTVDDQVVLVRRLRGSG